MMSNERSRGFYRSLTAFTGILAFFTLTGFSRSISQPKLRPKPSPTSAPAPRPSAKPQPSPFPSPLPLPSPQPQPVPLPSPPQPAPSAQPSPVVPAPVSGCSGKKGAPGDNNRSVLVGSSQRTFRLHVPANLDPNKPAPIVFLHHGITQTGAAMQSLTKMDEVADSEGFIAVYPDGLNQTWNIGVLPGGVDDLGFVDKMLESIEQDQCLNRGRVYQTGFSMGGFFTNYAGCELGNRRYRAAAPASGGAFGASTCPGGPLPIMILHGTADSVVAYSSGTSARDLWVKRNGCSSAVDSVPILGGTCEYHKGCPAEAQVVFCKFDGMDHKWAKGTYENGSRLIWNFFKKYQ
jgi:polyhydroxybutyrate depolymerase